MENYILNCYLKWLKQRNGTIFKQLSKLTMTANVLIVLLFSMLFILFVLTILAFYKWVDPNVIYIPMILEIITGIVYVFTILVGVGFIYIILAGSVYLISNLTIKKQQEKYMQLANDLQSIVDFRKTECTGETNEDESGY